MPYLLASIHLCVCLFFIFKYIKTPTPVFQYMGLLSVFSLGYYVLPFISMEWSGLSRYVESDIVSAQLIHLIFFISLIFGVFSSLYYVRLTANNFSFQAPTIDNFISKNMGIVFWVCWSLYLIYFFTAEHTSYSSSSFEDFFHKRSPLYSVIAFFSRYAQAAMVIILAFNISRGLNRQVYLQILAFVFTILLLMGVGQRLALITPLIMFFVSLGLFGNAKTANKVIVFTIILLFIISPFAVYLRGAQSGEFDAVAKFSEYKAKDSGIEGSVKSIVQRGDLLLNTIHLKKFIDQDHYVGSEYYYSILVAPMPKVIYPTKPYLLSDDGTIWGEISVLAWRLMIGETTGSLTAFGGITAYRQGGWFALVVDGLFAGFLSVFFITYLSQGGPFGKMVYIILFVSICVKKVPPSFFESLTTFLPFVPILIVAKYLPMFFKRER